MRARSSAFTSFCLGGESVSIALSLSIACWYAVLGVGRTLRVFIVGVCSDDLTEFGVFWTEGEIAALSLFRSRIIMGEGGLGNFRVWSIFPTSFSLFTDGVGRGGGGGGLNEVFDSETNPLGDGKNNAARNGFIGVAAVELSCATKLKLMRGVNITARHLLRGSSGSTFF